METKLALYSLDYKSENIYNYFCLGEQGDLKEINSSVIIFDIPLPKIIYEDHFTLDFKLFKNNKEDRKTAKNFNLDIYVGRLNQYYCFVNYINNYSFDIIIFRNYYKNIEKTINIQAEKKYTLDKNNSFGLKRCIKFGIINCDKSYLSQFDFHFPSHCIQGSYYLNIFYPFDNKPPKYSLHKIKTKRYRNIDFSSISQEKKDILLKMRENFINLYNKFDNNNENKMKTKLKFMGQMVEIFQKKFDFSELSNLQYLLARNVNLNLADEEFDICLGYVIYILMKEITFLFNSILFAGIIIDLLNDLEKNLDERNLNILRILLWFNSRYLKKKKFIDLFNSEEGLKAQESKIDFKICYPKKCKEKTPYHNAYIFLNNFVDKLTEDSHLLEILYLIDSEASSNIIYKNCRLFNLSLLSLEQIKSHLKYLIPEVVLRFKNSEKSCSNGSYAFDHGVVRIFENEIFSLGDDLDKFLLQKKDINCKYSIPIIMVLFHDCFCHGKIRLSSEGSESPNYFYNPYDNYEIYYHDENGESGRLFEFYISRNKDDIRFLKYSLEPLPELLDADLWTGKNLDKLNKIIHEKMNNYDINKIKNQDIVYFPIEQKKETLDYTENNEEYDSEKYAGLYEDDRKTSKPKKTKIKEKFC